MYVLKIRQIDLYLILYKRVRGWILQIRNISFHEDFFIFANSAYLGEMTQGVAFHLDLHYLPKYLSTDSIIR